MGILGAHVSTARGLERAPERGERLGCKAIQIFSKNQRQWRTKPLTAEDVEKFRKSRQDHSIGPVMVHDSYLINLGHPEPEARRKSVEAFHEEMVRAEELGVDFLVFHPGSHLNQISEDACLQKIGESLNGLFERTPGYRVKVLLETTAGQGSNVGYRFEHLARVLELVKDKNRLGVCIDTCHIFAAGYDIRTPEEWEKTFAEFDRIIGLKWVLGFHVNDSKKDLGSRVDRHEHIGEGFIGPEAFRLLVNDARFAHVPMVLETPGDEADYQRNLERLKALVT